MFVLTMNLPAHRVMGGEKSDEDDDGDEEDGLGDDNDSVDDKGGDEEIYAPWLTLLMTWVGMRKCMLLLCVLVH